jgi:hypothetical protein
MPAATTIRRVQTEVESARRDWEEGYRRLLAEADDASRERLLRQVDVVTEELRKRLGGRFTLSELAAAYPTSDAWAREAVAERAPSPGWPRTLALVGDAAFHLYARGAIDYTP